jgi:hypothetical protein
MVGSIANRVAPIGIAVRIADWCGRLGLDTHFRGAWSTLDNSSAPSVVLTEIDTAIATPAIAVVATLLHAEGARLWGGALGIGTASNARQHTAELHADGFVAGAARWVTVEDGAIPPELGGVAQPIATGGAIVGVRAAFPNFWGATGTVQSECSA